MREDVALAPMNNSWSETWKVYYWFTNNDGYKEKGSLVLYTRTKSDPGIGKWFGRKFPGYEVIKIVYQ